MDAKNVGYILAGVLIGAIIVFMLVSPASFFKGGGSSKFLAELPLNRSVAAGQIYGSISAASAQPSLNVTYSGYIKSSDSSGDIITTTLMNASAALVRYENSSMVLFSVLVPQSSAYSTSPAYQSSYTEVSSEIVYNGSSRFFCSPQLNALGYPQNSTYPCITQEEYGILLNTTYNNTVDSFALLQGKNISVTIRSAKTYDYGNYSCILLNGTFSGIAPASYVQYLDPSYYGNGESPPEMSGTFGTCLSKSYLVPLYLNVNARITYAGPSGFSSSGAADVYLHLNESSIGSAYTAESTSLPGTVMNLSDILVGYCSSPYYYTTWLSQSLSCFSSALVMNATGFLALNATNSGASSSQGNVDLLGLACIPYTFGQYNTLLPSNFKQPSPASFTPVNISVSLSPYYYNGTPIVFQCPISSRKLGSEFNGSLWAYYKYGNSTSVAELGTVNAYLTTRNPVGENMNTGEVTQLPKKLPQDQEITLSTLANPGYSASSNIYLFVDTYPGSFINGQFYNASSVSGYLSSFSYYSNFEGRHVVYIAIEPYVGFGTGQYYAPYNYSGDVYLGNAATPFSGINATRMLRLIIINGTVTNSSTVPIPG